MDERYYVLFSNLRRAEREYSEAMEYIENKELNGLPVPSDAQDRLKELDEYITKLEKEIDDFISK